ncbi:hypothetical protein [Pantoea cypripedii]|uniref:YopB/SseC family type III secretion system translocon subunit n=1 Tax=Pantoea cypripedii TaxID=55209 RepID=A0A6B9GD98_PANCY|nr:hypothetical protein [Pantoea cypripedii]QGY32187.1 hypothetical protein CUN67_24655 [Pantoea cypripedii]
MTTNVVGQRSPFLFQYYDSPVDKPKKSQQPNTETRTENVPQANDLDMLSQEVATFITRVQVQGVKFNERPAEREMLSEQLDDIKLRIKNALFTLSQSGGATSRLGVSLQQQLSQLLTVEQLLDETDGRAVDTSMSPVLMPFMKKALLRQTTAVPQSVQNPAAGTPTEQPTDSVALQQFVEELETLVSGLDSAWQAKHAQAQDAAITTLLNNPTSLTRTTPPAAFTDTTEKPQLAAPPSNSDRVFAELFFALRRVQQEGGAITTENDSKHISITRDYWTEVMTRRLQENRALVDKARQQQAAAESRGTIFKWVMRALMAVVGAIFSVLTLGLGAMLVTLAFTVVEIVLEETVGFSLMGKLTEYIGKGFSEAMKAMGADGEWVEYVANALAAIVVIVASILVTKGLGKLTNTQGCQSMINTIKDKLPWLKNLILKMSPDKMSGFMKFLDKNKTLMQGATTLMPIADKSTAFGYSFPMAQTQEDLSDNKKELKAADILKELIDDMMKDTPNALQRVTETSGQLVELVSDMLNKVIKRDRAMMLNNAAH